jgi:hypothetical protein
LFFLALFLSLVTQASAPAQLRPIAVNEQIVRRDLALILKDAHLPTDLLGVVWSEGQSNTVRFNCQKKPWALQVTSESEEKSATFYRGLRGLGFLFPHPRWQVSPTLNDIKRQCGKTFNWKPTLRHRGLHLHTLHPNEWVRGFLMDRSDVANEIVRWSARNGQNLIDVSLLRIPLEKLQHNFKAPFQLARDLGVHTGVSLGVALQQQNSYKLLTLWQAITGFGSDEALERELEKLIAAIDTSFIVLEAGTSEFTSTDPESTIKWLNQADAIARKHGRAIFTKVHVSSNQQNKKWGNYNFLPSFAAKTVGVLPHTVMFYGLLDPKAPMYGNKDFHGIRKFMEKESQQRPAWYYPETGYWVAMDADIPLLLTDYLRTRAEDLKWLHENKMDGQLIFSTGHGLAGWLYDWTQALLIDEELEFDPYIGLTLLGEDRGTWEKIFAHQRYHFKESGVIPMISAANLQDELSSTHRIHDRHTIKEVAGDEKVRETEIRLLTAASATWPDTTAIKDAELARLLLVTRLRVEQALQLRLAMREDDKRAESLENAKLLREQAARLLSESRNDQRNYADLGVMDVWANPTSYQFGYIYPSASLYWWAREERMVREDSYWPFTGNIYDIWDILL